MVISTGVSWMGVRSCAMTQPIATPIAAPPASASANVRAPADGLKIPPPATAMAML